MRLDRRSTTKTDSDCRSCLRWTQALVACGSPETLFQDPAAKALANRTPSDLYTFILHIIAVAGASVASMEKSPGKARSEREGDRAKVFSNGSISTLNAQYSTKKAVDNAFYNALAKVVYPQVAWHSWIQNAIITQWKQDTDVEVASSATS